MITCYKFANYLCKSPEKHAKNSKNFTYVYCLGYENKHTGIGKSVSKMADPFGDAALFEEFEKPSQPSDKILLSKYGDKDISLDKSSIGSDDELESSERQSDSSQYAVIEEDIGNRVIPNGKSCDEFIYEQELRKLQDEIESLKYESIFYLSIAL